MLPLIGITTFRDVKPRAAYTSVSDHYIRSIAAAGGLPVALPVTDDQSLIAGYLEAVDGILFSGGADVAPWRFNEEPIRQLGGFAFGRDEFEMRLFEGARERGTPIFGICRGHQLINIALGGAVYQDIYTQIADVGGHNPAEFPVDELYHHVTVRDQDSVMGSIFGPGKTLVNSFHHQAVSTMGAGLVATAFSEDGIVEASEGRGLTGPNGEPHYISTVQFHPESLTIRYPRFLQLFESFVGAARVFSE